MTVYVVAEVNGPFTGWIAYQADPDDGFVCISHVGGIGTSPPAALAHLKRAEDNDDIVDGIEHGRPVGGGMMIGEGGTVVPVGTAGSADFPFVNTTATTGTATNIVSDQADPFSDPPTETVGPTYPQSPGQT